MVVDFDTYFSDELNCGVPIADILEMYNWRSYIRCPHCGMKVTILDAWFDPDWDQAYCEDCAKGI